jgi:glucose/arabinose dehydrogenase
VIDIPAHSAPLGLAFVANDSWPAEYQNDLFVSYHGSWNRSSPTGYKIVRHEFDEQGNFTGVEDFITGWLSGGSALGRPAGILSTPDGKIYISDDKAGVIYLVEWIGE